MGLEFRQRGPSEYVQSLLRRKWLILLPALAIATAIGIVVMRLPSIYKSSALLVVKTSSLSPVVAMADGNEMQTKLISMTQLVTSRTSLEQLIKKYGLYKEERERGLSMDSIINKMTKDVEVELSQRNEVINGFTISYRGRDPRTAKNVTEELAGKCITTEVDRRAVDTRENKEFFDTQLNTLKGQMDAIDKERADYLRSNLSNLPDEQVALVQQLTGLREQQKTLYSEIGRLRDQTTMQGNLLAAKEEQVKRDIARINGEGGGDDITNSQVYAELVKQRTTLQSELQQMRKVLRDKNPDVIAKQEQIANVDKQIEQERARSQDRAERKKETLTAGLSGETPESTTIRSNMQGLENERKRQEALLAQTDREIAAINQRLSNIPTTKVNLDAINRRFTEAQTQYATLLEKSQKVNLLGELNTNNRGDSIILQDAANLPQTPVAPKRPILIGLGLVLGLGVGLFLAMLAEAPRFFTIQTMDDAEHYTGLPVLVALPELMTPEETTRRPRLRLAYLAAGVLVSLVSIPLFVKALSFTQIFERLVL